MSSTPCTPRCRSGSIRRCQPAARPRRRASPERRPAVHRLHRLVSEHAQQPSLRGSNGQPGTRVDGRQTTGRYAFLLGVRGRAPVMSMPRDHIAADPAGHGRPGASHADREQVIEVLKTAFVQGRLTKEEFGTRIGQAFTSQTYAELTKVTADLPAGPMGARPPRQARPDAAPPVDERGHVGRRVRDAHGARGHVGRGRQPQRDSDDQRGRDHRDLGGSGIRGPDGRVVAGESTLTEGEERRSLRKRTASSKTRLPAWASVARGLPKR